jgi:excisionase family DNA binding protein
VKEYITTGQAAILCSVTPDAVLKWIKAGKIPARRTPGGHYRIRSKDIQHLIESETSLPVTVRKDKRPFQYCWEFNSGSSEVLEECRKCIVYRSKTLRCYEMVRLPSEAGHARFFCRDSCEECDYYRLVRGQRPNILIVTDKPSLRASVEAHSGDLGYNVRFTDCEYNCSMLIEEYRADWVILDCSMGMERAKQFAQHISADPRIPFARIVMVGSRVEFPQGCDKEVFARIERPFTAKVLQELIDNLKEEPGLQTSSAG